MKKPSEEFMSDVLYHVKHGMQMPCPVCSAPGRLDLSAKVELEFPNSIWYNTECGHWECWDCWLK